MNRRETQSITWALWALAVIAAIAFGFFAGRANGQVQIISEPTREPTQAATCACQGDGECVCPPGECDCGPKVSKPIVTVVRKPRIDDQSPITLAPDPAYDDAIAAFTERHSGSGSSVWVGSQLPPEPSPAAVSSGTTRPPALTKQPPIISTPAAVTTAQTRPSATAQPPITYKPVPIERAAMTYQCVNGVCQWVPTSQAPTKTMQTPAVQQRQYQRSRFRLFRRR